MSLWLISLILVVHFLADFPLQLYPWGSWMALNKSKSWKALLCHTSVYSLSFFWLGWKFVLCTWVLHSLTDGVTSRWTSKLWFMDKTVDYPNGIQLWKFAPNRYAPFFSVIGLDQLIHVVTLLWTLKLLS